MHPLRTTIIALACCTLLSGCLASMAIDAATAPVRVAGKAVDLATTSRSEADERRGRQLREREQRLGQLERSWQHHSRQCADGDRDACRKAAAERAEINRLIPTIPAEPVD